MGEGLQRAFAAAKMTRSKGRAVPRERSEIDESTYSGRVAARIRKLVDEKAVPINAIVDALIKDGHKASARTVFAYLNHTRTIHPDIYPVFARVLKVKLPELLPTK